MLMENFLINKNTAIAVELKGRDEGGDGGVREGGRRGHRKNLTTEARGGAQKTFAD